MMGEEDLCGGTVEIIKGLEGGESERSVGVVLKEGDKDVLEMGIKTPNNGE